jgi:TolB protein
MPLEGGNPRLVADLAANAFAPAWSPDGTEIAFYSRLGSGNALHVVSADGGDPRVIADLPFDDEDPAWSPDGLSIAFVSRGLEQNDPFSAWTVWTVSRESVGAVWAPPVRLTAFSCVSPTWSHDGESLLCRSGPEFVIVSTSGDVVHRLDPQMNFGTARFSPDGSKVYFFGQPADEWGIWSMPVTGGEPTKLVAFDDPSLTVRLYVRSLTVGPDHFYLTIAEYESDIWVMDLEWE